MKSKSDITYIESIGFANQFCINRRKIGSIKNQSRFCLVSITQSKSNELNEYLQERQYMIKRFNIFLTKQLKTNENLSLDSFKILRQLGKGGYGSVFLAYYINTNEYIALKAIKKSTLIETNEQNIIISERQYTFALNHPNIVNINRDIASRGRLGRNVPMFLEIYYRTPPAFEIIRVKNILHYVIPNSGYVLGCSEMTFCPKKFFTEIRHPFCTEDCNWKNREIGTCDQIFRME